MPKKSSGERKKRMSASVDEESTGRREQKKPNSSIEKQEYTRDFKRFGTSQPNRVRQVRSA